VDLQVNAFKSLGAWNSSEVMEEFSNWTSLWNAHYSVKIYRGYAWIFKKQNFDIRIVADVSCPVHSAWSASWPQMNWN
jgi:hypothetical protein